MLALTHRLRLRFRWKSATCTEGTYLASSCTAGLADDVSLRVFVRTWHADIIFPAPCIWHLLVPSCRLKSTRRGFSVTFFQKCYRVLRCLARQRIHVCVSVRVCGRLCLATETGTHRANCTCNTFVSVLAAQFLVR